MSLTTRQMLQVGVTAAVALAAVVGGLVSKTATGPVTGPNLVPSPAQAAGDTVYAYRATIEVDTQTGRLHQGYIDTRYGGTRLGTYWCGVATQLKPTFRRVLTTHVVTPVRYNFACASAFAQWDSAEWVTHGRWPKP